MRFELTTFTLATSGASEHKALSDKGVTAGGEPLSSTDSSKLAEETPPAAPVTPTPAPSLPDDLRCVVDAWASLPAAIRAGIVAMVRTAGDIAG
jgi:hypothetical protein